jgi:hypothetical protein
VVSLDRGGRPLERYGLDDVRIERALGQPRDVAELPGLVLEHRDDRRAGELTIPLCPLVSKRARFSRERARAPALDAPDAINEVMRSRHLRRRWPQVPGCLSGVDSCPTSGPTTSSTPLTGNEAPPPAERPTPPPAREAQRAGQTRDGGGPRREEARGSGDLEVLWRRAERQVPGWWPSACACLSGRTARSPSSSRSPSAGIPRRARSWCSTRRPGRSSSGTLGRAEPRAPAPGVGASTPYRRGGRHCRPGCGRGRVARRVGARVDRSVARVATPPELATEKDLGGDWIDGPDQPRSVSRLT